MKKVVLIEWLKEYFIRESKELPDTTRLYTQLYVNGEVWTLVVDFETSPKEQGFLSIGVCHLLITDAPVELVTTDGFLYPNQTLIEQGILNRKGFPESYDMEALLNFLDHIKNGQDVDIPVYSHEVYDIVPEEKQSVKAADFVIVEGINVFQNPQNERLYITDFFDFSIYVDAAVDDIESWYLDRFLKMLSLAQNDPDSYYYRFTQMPIGEVESFAHQVWTSINLTNLQNYIEPTRNRAEVILHKTKNHEIDEIYLKK